jgi:hypothetical protein
VVAASDFLPVLIEIAICGGRPLARCMNIRRRIRRSRTIPVRAPVPDHVEQQIATWHQDLEGTYRHHMAELLLLLSIVNVGNVRLQRCAVQDSREGITYERPSAAS